MPISRYFAYPLLLAFLFPGCTDKGLQKYSLETPAQVLRPVSSPSAMDGRTRFREIFCSLLADAPDYLNASTTCDDYLTRLSDEPALPGERKPLPVPNTRMRILVVPGLFGECIADVVFPFEIAMERLRELGYKIDPLIVSGRSSSDHNAAQIADAVANLELEEQEPLVLVGHSKGAVDILHFLLNYPDLGKRVTAVVSVAGAINGSPLADLAADVYKKLASKIPFKNCEPGDMGAFESLRRSARLSWLAAHPLPSSVQYYSVVAFTDRDSVNKLLIKGYDMLNRIDPRNDGLLLFSDQVIPGAVLLGYVNADHYTVVLPIAQKKPTLSNSFVNPKSYPRDVLLHAVVLYLAETFTSSGPRD